MHSRPALISIALFSVVLLATSLAACGPKSATADEPTPAQIAAAAKAAGTVNGICPVMLRLVVADGGTTDYEGQKIGFCCPPCPPKFRKDPERYMDAMRKDPTRFGYTKP